MKNLFLSCIVFIVTASSVLPHGLGGDFYTADGEREVARDRQASFAGKSFTKPSDSRDRWWGASLTTGWTSREMHYGVDETVAGTKAHARLCQVDSGSCILA
jgi:hypothetical protein